MSYDISLVIDTGKEEREILEIGNYTYNCGSMFAKATEKQYSLSDLNGMNCKEVAKIINFAIINMRSNPEKYKKLNPENGWGDYTSFLEYVEKIEKGCLENPKCNLLVC